MTQPAILPVSTSTGGPNPDASANAAAQDTGPVTISAPVINQTAQALKNMPTNVNPLFNPAAMRTLPRQARAAIHAAAGQVINGQPPAFRGVTVDIDALEGIHGIESAGTIDPRTGLLRLPQARLEVCGSAKITLTASVTTGTLKWNPQRDFKAVRLVIPSAENSGSFIQNLLVGNKPIYLGTGAEPVECFSELATSGMVDFPICRVGITIAATFTNSTLGASTDYYTALLGYVTDGKQVEPLKGFLRRMAIPPTSVTSGTTTVISLNPQDAFKVRKFAVDQSIAASFIVDQVSIGNEPQLLSGDPIPAQAFADRSQDVWVDWDRCKTGQQIFITITNISGATASFQGALLGDVDESSPF